MKKLLGAFLSAFAFVALVAGPAAADKISLGVDEFRNDTSAAWWHGGVGHDLAGMLSNELASTENFKIVERKKLDSVLKEQDLAASGRVAPKKAAKIGQITGADYLVMATVTAYEENVSERDAGISFGGISLGGSKDDAYMAVDLRVVNTTTGDVEFSRTIEGKSGGMGLSLGVFKGGFGGTLGGKEKTPHGKAIRAAIIEISEYLSCVMVDKDSCVDEYKAKEQKRKKKTKESLQLDE
ncbi:MAG: CsgG/HfaB family protein [Nitrospinae bacterium]|nr:CsgG/HfaB family protein [Nitrospinota bacterium]